MIQQMPRVISDRHLFGKTETVKKNNHYINIGKN